MALAWLRFGSTAVAMLAVLVLCAPAGATALVNDPAQPLSASDFAKAQYWLSRSHVPTAPGTYLLSGGSPHGMPVAVSLGAASCAEHHVWLNLVDREGLMHEMGHQAQCFLYSRAQLTAVQNIMGMGGQPFGDNPQLFGRTPMEVGADANAECAMHQTWPGKWWDHTHRTREGVLHSDRDRTAYDFRAGPRNFARICAVYRFA